MIESKICPEFRFNKTNEKDIVFKGERYAYLIKLASLIFNTDTGREYLKLLLEDWVLATPAANIDESRDSIVSKSAVNEFIKLQIEWANWNNRGNS